MHAGYLHYIPSFLYSRLWPFNASSDFVRVWRLRPRSQTGLKAKILASVSASRHAVPGLGFGLGLEIPYHTVTVTRNSVKLNYSEHWQSILLLHPLLTTVTLCDFM